MPNSYLYLKKLVCWHTRISKYYCTLLKINIRGCWKVVNLTKELLKKKFLFNQILKSVWGGNFYHFLVQKYKNVLKCFWPDQDNLKEMEQKTKGKKKKMERKRQKKKGLFLCFFFPIFLFVFSKVKKKDFGSFQEVDLVENFSILPWITEFSMLIIF